MGTTLKSKRALAAILIVIVAISVTGLSTYAVINNQKSTQQNYLLSIVLFQLGQPRIVSCAPSIDEILYGLGLVDYIVGCVDHDPYGYGYSMQDFYLPRIVELILAGRIKNEINWWSPSPESIVSLNPTIVLLDSGVPAQVSLYSSLVSQGIYSFLVPQGTRISQIEVSILQIGSLFKRSSVAQALVDKMETKISTIQGNVSSQSVLNVLVCVWIDFDRDQIYTCGNSTFLSEIVQKAGGLNVFYDDTQPWPIKTFVQAAAKNPDKIIILDHYAYLDPSTTYTNIKTDPNLGNTPAAMNDEIYFVQGQAENLFSRPGPRVAEGVELLANILFPVLFNETFTGPPYILNTGNYKSYVELLILE
ncbi:MAG: ABC transporter substrate-binding protein [Candidatus Freyarchaeota archaeon]|nr:ABC transporter substrate-binding protein [Candidatus Jordarchaeia archaeon]